jgi:hypothetical protein
MLPADPHDHPTPQLVPRLSPGLRVVRRGRHHLQVGLYDERRVLLPRTEAVERTLAMLLQRRPVGSDPTTWAVLDRLEGNGCLTWQSPTPADRPGVGILGGFTGPGLPDVTALLAAAEVDVTPGPEADAVLVLSPGELDRDRLDPLVRSRTSHVVVRLVDGGAVLGPFVVPGRTACLRCIDAHQSVGDPDHVAVTTRYARATARARQDGVPDLDPPLASIALAWAVRDVVTHLEGHEPATWSRTVHLGAPPTHLKEQRWLRHPRCGCSWPADAEYLRPAVVPSPQDREE